MNLWNIPGIPHKGWTCVDVIDLGPGRTRDGECDRGTCQMCGNEEIRYIHIMSHPQSPKNFQVGCICAEKMSGDYVNPRKRENALKSKAKWLTRKWRVSAKGNSYLNVEGYTIGVFRAAGSWKYWIDDYFSVASYSTEASAKLALFDKFNFLSH